MAVSVQDLLDQVGEINTKVQQLSDAIPGGAGADLSPVMDALQGLNAAVQAAMDKTGGAPSA